MFQDFKGLHPQTKERLQNPLVKLVEELPSEYNKQLTIFMSGSTPMEVAGGHMIKWFDVLVKNVNHVLRDPERVACIGIKLYHTKHRKSAEAMYAMFVNDISVTEYARMIKDQCQYETETGGSKQLRLGVRKDLGVERGPRGYQ